MSDNSAVTVWLKPVGPSLGTSPSAGGRAQPSGQARFKVVQRGKRFDPHVLVVPAGSSVEFPNLDPFFHNVFSLFDGKRFDLGLYEAGTTRSVVFPSPGVCYVFCNIHPDMSAVILVVDSPYYATSNRAGEFSLPSVPPGRYVLSVWHERYTPEDANDFPKEVSISPNTVSLGTIRLRDPGQIPTAHKNKFGHDYVPPTPTPVYR